MQRGRATQEQLPSAANAVATSKATGIKALHNSFTGIDTANQRKHYFEAGVGEAVQKFCRQTGT